MKLSSFMAVYIGLFPWNVRWLEGLRTQRKDSHRMYLCQHSGSYMWYYWPSDLIDGYHRHAKSWNPSASRFSGQNFCLLGKSNPLSRMSKFTPISRKRLLGCFCMSAVPHYWLRLCWGLLPVWCLTGGSHTTEPGVHFTRHLWHRQECVTKDGIQITFNKICVSWYSWRSDGSDA